jgi:hypothetical protein
MTCHGKLAMARTTASVKSSRPSNDFFPAPNNLMLCASVTLWQKSDSNSDNSVNSVKKNRLKRDRLVFFFRQSVKLTRYERIKIRSLEWTRCPVDSRLLLLGFSLLSSNFELLVSEKSIFGKTNPNYARHY